MWTKASPRGNDKGDGRPQSNEKNMRESAKSSLRATNTNSALLEKMFSNTTEGTIMVKVEKPHVVIDKDGKEYTAYTMAVDNDSKLFPVQHYTKSIRFSEVYALREQLVKGKFLSEEETQKMPKLPEKSWNDRFKGDVVQRRCKAFQILLEFLVMRPIRDIKAPVILFLTPPTTSVSRITDSSDDGDSSSVEEFIDPATGLIHAPAAKAKPSTPAMVLKLRPACDLQQLVVLKRELAVCSFPSERLALVKKFCTSVHGCILAKDAARLITRYCRFPREKLDVALVMKDHLVDPHNVFLLEETLQFSGDKREFKSHCSS